MVKNWEEQAELEGRDWPGVPTGSFVTGAKETGQKASRANVAQVPGEDDLSLVHGIKQQGRHRGNLTRALSAAREEPRREGGWLAAEARRWGQ